MNSGGLDISTSIALTMAGQVGAPSPPVRRSSLRYRYGAVSPERRSSFSSKDTRLYRGVSCRERGWKKRNSFNENSLSMRFVSKETNIRRWDGILKSSTQWDGLRRDPELWFPDGNCLIHLYAYGQSQRGPAFRIPIDALVSTYCQPLIEKFMHHECIGSPISDASSSTDGGYYGQPSRTEKFELYIPAPSTAAREHAFIHHMATRNFFAWMFGLSLVGTHLGGALIGLLNSMEEWRCEDQDNLRDIMEYMDEEGYSDLRCPDHALGMLFFAEHFRLKDLYIDSFAHCTGMYDDLIYSPGYEQVNRLSRALIGRSRVEMDLRLDSCGRILSTFLQDELSGLSYGLSRGARAHLDSFRSFLQTYYVEQLGYYPPAPYNSKSNSFSKGIYSQMCIEFENLYNFLANKELTASDIQFTSTDIISNAVEQGQDIWEQITSFNAHYKHESLLYPLPLLPEAESSTPSRLSRRMSWVSGKADKLKPDSRLVACSALLKATNRADSELYESSLVRAYRGFEKEYVFSTMKVDKAERISSTEARKVRWFAIYTIFQTLLSATAVPEQVRDSNDVPYFLCIKTTGLPPWNDRIPRAHKHSHSLPGPLKLEIRTSITPTLSRTNSVCYAAPEAKQDVDHFTSTGFIPTRSSSISSLSSSLSGLAKKGSVKRALSSLGSMPELVHPTPRRLSYHEILISGYGDGTHIAEKTIDSLPIAEEAEEDSAYPKPSSESSYSVSEEQSSQWSTSDVAEEPETPGTCMSLDRYSVRRDSDDSKISIKDFLDGMTGLGLRKMSSTTSFYSVGELEEIVVPRPLDVTKSKDTTTLAQTTNQAQTDRNPDDGVEDEDETTEGLIESLSSTRVSLQ